MKNFGKILLVTLVAAVSFTTTVIAEESAVSSYCLSCHVDHSTAAAHPVGVDYESARRYSYSLRPSNTRVATGGTIEDTLLVDGKVECTSCHVTHDEPSESRHRMREMPGRWVRESDDYTFLCMSCHDPK